MQQTPEVAHVGSSNDIIPIIVRTYVHPAEPSLVPAQIDHTLLQSRSAAWEGEGRVRDVWARDYPHRTRRAASSAQIRA